MKFIEPRPFADPEAAARKLVELANAFEPIQDGRIYIEKISVSRAADIPTGWEITLDLVRRVAALDGTSSGLGGFESSPSSMEMAVLNRKPAGHLMACPPGP